MKWRRRSLGQADSGSTARILVVGGGFAGLSAMEAMAHWDASVTLLDRNPYSTFQPLLYQVATAGLTASDVAYPLAAVSRRHKARFRRGELAGIDAAGRRALLADGTQFDYDYLILATGVSAAYFGVTGAAEHSLSLYTRHDAVVLRDRLMAELEQRSQPGAGTDLNITVVGGGATGVELTGTLAELRNIALPAAFPEMDPSRMHVRLVEQGPALIAPFHATLREYAHRQLLARGVEVRLDSTIREVSADCVILADGTKLPSDVIVWAAGVAAPDSAARLGLPRGPGGRIIVGPDLRVDGQDRIFAVGDIALIDGQSLPQLAQPAIQEGRHAANQIRRLLTGRPTEALSYHDKGIMATIGHRSAVVQLPHHLRIRGTLAWLAWLGLHLFTLLGNRNRISALVNLSWRYLTWSRGGGVIMGDDPPRDR